MEKTLLEYLTKEGFSYEKIALLHNGNRGTIQADNRKHSGESKSYLEYC